MPKVRMCAVQWASPEKRIGSGYVCPNPATHVAIMMDMLSVVTVPILCCSSCKDLCVGMDHWGFVEIPEKYRMR